jgi:hypothetical protein
LNNEILICYSCSQIFELCYIFNGFVTHQCIMFLSCNLLARHKHMFSFLCTYRLASLITSVRPTEIFFAVFVPSPNILTSLPESRNRYIKLNFVPSWCYWTSISGGHILHPQPEDASWRGGRDPRNNTKKGRRHMSMRRTGFESKIPVFERYGSIRVLNLVGSRTNQKKKNYEGRLKSLWTQLITPSQNFVEVRWRSLFRSVCLGSTSWNAPPVDHFEISCIGAPFSLLENPRNRMGRGRDLYVVSDRISIWGPYFLRPTVSRGHQFQLFSS